jgi:lipoate-protein ligase A
MGIDGSLLEEGLPVLRLYRWLKPTLSLGYFQKISEVADEGFLQAQGLDWVQRPTGGGAILHDRELTFSLTLPAAHPALRGGINESYLELTRPLLEILRSLKLDASFRGEGPAIKAANCFAGAACPDIVVGGKKVFGSAQRRKGHAVLLHGSLLFSIDQALWQGVFGANYGQGFAGIGHENEDWEALLKGAYSQALKLDFRAVKVGLRETTT